MIALKFLDDRPEQANWLTAEERRALAETLAAEAKATRATGYAGLGQALTRPRVLVLGLIYFCIVVGLYGIGFWMPQVIQTFGLDPLRDRVPHRDPVSVRRHRHGAMGRALGPRE